MVGIVGFEGITTLFEYAIAAIKGGRNYQEDSAAVWFAPEKLGPGRQALPVGAGELVAVLADGMGGHAGGALASQTICETFIDDYVKTSGDAIQRLRSALLGANRKLAQKVKDDEELAGMGATAVGLSVGTWGAHWISVGDSPLFLYRDRELVVLNEDHSMAPVLDKMAERGEISRADARADGRRHFLRSAVSGSEIEMIDRSVMPLPLMPGDYLVIASDGIQTLENDAIQDCITAHCAAGAKRVADELVAAVDAEGVAHQDNATVLVINVVD